ncbi:DUF58 domain-containing protein [Nocardioides zhouii]|uniref:DUF58 domain-containing protein n=1 Tax=Nocardioides zhouii TaxID=1168729 RepID=A0A4Q2SYI8_9ACTN|nr:DUF58 domain-containing protein [Nocardioides zhouii]RYC11062.1 DUF58 domain-containing protein [Nocardioides zhouii]
MSSATPAVAGRRRLPRADVSGWVTGLGRSRAVTGTRRVTDDVWNRTASWRQRAAGLGGFVTPLGWIALLSLALAVVVGLDRSWSELTAVATALGVALLAALAWVMGKTAYDVDIALDSERVQVGDDALGRLLIRNRGSRSLLPTSIELPVARAVASFDLPALGRHDEHEELFAVPTRRRGVIPVGPVVSVRADPLHLLRRAQRWTEQVELFVHPRTLVIDSGHAGFLKDVEGVTTQDLSSSDVSFHALRDYVPGDDRRAIHWKTTARTGKFMVRVFEETRRSHLLLLLSLRPEDYSTSDDFEMAVSSVASLGLQCLREDRDLSVVTQAGHLRFPSGRGLLDELSRVELVPGSAAVPSLAENGVALVPSASIVALVTGDGADAAALRAADRAAPLDAFTFAVRCAGDQTVARRKIGRLTVLDLSDLDDLPRAVRTMR